jgi:hypothetical protein
MANKVVQVVLDLVNAAYNRAIKDSGKHTEEFAKKSKRHIDDTGTAWMNMAAVIGGLVFALKKFIDTARVQEQVTAQMGAVLRSTHGAAGMTAESLTALAQSLQNVSVFSDEAIMGAENLLLTFTNVGQNVFPQAMTAILDVSQAMGKNLTESAQMVGKAINDPIAGISRLTDVGVVFNDEQRRTIERLQRSGDLMGAQRVILNELATEFGGSAAAAAFTFSGRLQQMANRMEDLQQTIGRALLPGLASLADVFMENTDSGDQFNKSLEQMAKDASAVLKIIANITKKLLKYRDTIESIARYTGVGALLQYNRSVVGYIADNIGDEEEPQEQPTPPPDRPGGGGSRTAPGGGGNRGPSWEDAIRAKEQGMEKLVLREEQYARQSIAIDASKHSERLKQIEEERVAEYNLMRDKLGFNSRYYEGLQAMASMGTALMQSENKKIFRVGQALAMSNSIINAAEAVMKGWTYGPFIGVPYAALVATSLAVQLKNIKAQKPPAMAVGTWQVPRDMTATIHRGEQIIPRPMAEAVRSGEAALTGAGARATGPTYLVVDGRIMGEVVDNYRLGIAKNMGANSYAMKSVYR